MGHSNLQHLQLRPSRIQGVGRSASARIDLARDFMRELHDDHDSLSALGERHGAKTLADVAYLFGAIMGGTFIEHVDGTSMLLHVVSALPSSLDWLTYVDVVEPE
jgi:hypothetical protein